MTVVDYEMVTLDFKAWLRECSDNNKRSFGASELFEKLADLEVRSRLAEGQGDFDDRPPRQTSGVTSHDEPVPAGSGAS